VKIAIGIMMLLSVLYFFLGAIMSAAWTVTYTESVEFTVSGKERGSGDYEIYTDKGVFLNQDSMMFLKFNSADIQAELKEGSKYVCSAQGFRLNWYNKRYIKNLLSCKPHVTA
jgi:hypothetical protein